MYGYIVPDKSCLKSGDFAVYRAYYCGLCKTIGKKYGQLPRVTVSYDMTFFSALVFDLLGADVRVASENCILGPFSKKAVVVSNPLLESIAAFSILFAYHNLEDDVRDGGGLAKKFARNRLKKAYSKAKAELPDIDAVIIRSLDELYSLEREKCGNIDKVSDAFGTLLRSASSAFLGKKSSETTENFFYNIGKWVYLIDALDDIGEDYKKGNYNPFLASLGDYKERAAFFKDNKGVVDFIINITVNRIIEDFNGMVFTQCYDLLKNIVYYGLRKRTKEVLESKTKLKPERI